jgi:hypothetical protein
MIEKIRTVHETLIYIYKAYKKIIFSSKQHTQKNIK